MTQYQITLDTEILNQLSLSEIRGKPVWPLCWSRSKTRVLQAQGKEQLGAAPYERTQTREDQRNGSYAQTSVVQLAHEGEGFDFLGYHFRRVPVAQNPHRHFCACWPSRKAMQAARDRVRDLTPLHRVGLPVSQVVGDLNRFLHG